MKVTQSFSLDLPYRTPEADAIKLMQLVAQALEVEVSFSIEEKKANKKKHIHGYTTVHPSKLSNLFKTYFLGLSFEISECYDLKGWQNYITKENELQIAKPN